MGISVVMPALEMGQETGKLLAWRKKEGESVSEGEPLLEIETDKAVVEIESLFLASARRITSCSFIARSLPLLGRSPCPLQPGSSTLAAR
jgi:Biotin-requiring enzyme